MITLNFSYLKSFAIKNLLKVIAAILAYFIPLRPLFLATVLFCFSDFITGLVAAKKTGVAIESKKMKHKVYDLVFYTAALVLSYVFYEQFKSFIDFELYRLTAFIILSVEFWSNMENISKIVKIPLLTKDKFFETVNKFKPHTSDEQPNGDSKGN